MCRRNATDPIEPSCEETLTTFSDGRPFCVPTLHSTSQVDPFGSLASAPQFSHRHPIIKTIFARHGLALVALFVMTLSAWAGDQESIQGTWTLESASLDGQVMRIPTVVYVFAGDTLTVRPASGPEQKAAFTLDLTSKPKILVVQHGANPDRSPFELDGDTLKIAFTSPGEHPTDVSDKGHVLFTLKRTK